MGYSQDCSRLILTISLLIQLYVNVKAVNTDKDKRCLESPTPAPALPHCMLQTVQPDPVLWCDDSHFNTIPDSNTHRYVDENEARNAKTLFINTSCLEIIRRGDLAPYESLTKFFANDNRLETISRKVFFDNKKLEIIELNKNYIKTIDPEAFKGLRRLARLDLSENLISSFPRNVWLGLIALKELNLNNNILISPDLYWFNSLTNLEILHMTGNHIQVIHRNTFINLKNLKELRLDRNKISTVEFPNFFSSLRYLNLSSNSIKIWNEAFGKSMQTLEVLDLGKNFIKSLTPKHFENMNELRRLSLNNNSLGVIENNTFSGTSKLVFLNLSENYIRSIPVNAFSTLKNLRTLLLRKNNIEYPHQEWFKHIITQENVTIDLKENHWHCECEIVKYQHFVDSVSEQSIQKQLSITCTYPNDRREKKLDNGIAAEIERSPECHSGSPATRLKTFKPTTKLTTTSRPVVTTTTTTTTPRKIGIVERTNSAPSFIDETPEMAMYLFDDTELTPTEEKHTFIAVIASLSAVIVIIVVFVYLWRKRSKKRKAKTRLDSQSSATPFLNGENSNSGQDFGMNSVSTIREDEIMLSRPSSSIRNAQVDSQNHCPNRVRAVTFEEPIHPSTFTPLNSLNQESYYTPATVPKSIFSSEDQNITSINTERNLTVPGGGSVDSFSSCKDLTGEYNLLHPVGDKVYECGPQSDQFHSVTSRGFPDGSELET